MKNSKLNYEKASIELIYFSTGDIMSFSRAFDGEDDEIGVNWTSNKSLEPFA